MRDKGSCYCIQYDRYQFSRASKTHTDALIDCIVLVIVQSRVSEAELSAQPKLDLRQDL